MPVVDQHRVGAELTRFGTAQMAERLRQQGALQQRENELLRAQLAREADLSKAEGRWAAKLEQQERRHKKEIAEHARQRELREQERERERQAARDRMIERGMITIEEEGGEDTSHDITAQ